MIDRPHWVYRCLDEHGKPLYVGCTCDLFGRLRFHRSNTVWAPAVAKVIATVHPDRRSALAVERAEIVRLDPAWNVMGRWQSNHRWTRADFDQYLAAIRARTPRVTTSMRRHVRNVEAIRDARFSTKAVS